MKKIIINFIIILIVTFIIACILYFCSNIDIAPRIFIGASISIPLVILANMLLFSKKNNLTKVENVKNRILQNIGALLCLIFVISILPLVSDMFSDDIKKVNRNFPIIGLFQYAQQSSNPSMIQTRNIENIIEKKASKNHYHFVIDDSQSSASNKEWRWYQYIYQKILNDPNIQDIINPNMLNKALIAGGYKKSLTISKAYILYLLCKYNDLQSSHNHRFSLWTLSNSTKHIPVIGNNDYEKLNSGAITSTVDRFDNITAKGTRTNFESLFTNLSNNFDESNSQDYNHIITIVSDFVMDIDGDYQSSKETVLSIAEDFRNRTFNFVQLESNHPVKTKKFIEELKETLEQHDNTVNIINISSYEATNPSRSYPYDVTNKKLKFFTSSTNQDNVVIDLFFKEKGTISFSIPSNKNNVTISGLTIQKINQFGKTKDNNWKLEKYTKDKPKPREDSSFSIGSRSNVVIGEIGSEEGFRLTCFCSSKRKPSSLCYENNTENILSVSFNDNLASYHIPVVFINLMPFWLTCVFWLGLVVDVLLILFTIASIIRYLLPQD